MCIKQILFITLAVFSLQKNFAQDIIMGRGNHCQTGVYETTALSNFTKVKWVAELDAKAVQNLIIKGDTIYASAVKGTHRDSVREGFFYAIDIIKGEIIWKNSVNSFLSYPTIKDTMLYYGSDDKPCIMRAISKNKGNVIWEFPLDKHSCWPPALFQNKALFGDHNGNFFVVNGNNGEELFTQNIGAGICCTPSIYKKSAYYMDLRGGLHRFNPITYKDSVIFNTGSGLNNPPIIVNDIAYLASGSGLLIAYNLKTNTILWKTKVDDSMYRSPAVSDSIATVITSNSNIYAFNTKTGETLWKLKKEGLGYTNTTITESVVYIGCPDSYLYAYDLKTGQELWKYKTNAPVNTPTVQNGIVYFTSGNYIYALQ